MHSLKYKILLLTLSPLLLVLIIIGFLTVSNKSTNERYLLLGRLNSYRSMIESGDLAFGTSTDKVKLTSLLGEQVEFSEILASDYSVLYSSENTTTSLITEAEKKNINDAFQGIETTSNDKVSSDGDPVFVIISPIVVNGKVIAVLHQGMSNVDSNNRVKDYALYIGILIFFSIIVCFIFILILLNKGILKNILKLKNLTLEVQKGNLGIRSDIVSRDEIGDLSTNFNSMTEKLQELYLHLDDKVKEKTDQLSVKIKESDDQNKAILNILEDVEKSKKYSEELAQDLEKFKLAVENVSDQIVITDAEGIVIYGNKAVEKITGYKAEEALGKKAGALWKSPMSTEYYKDLWNVIKEQKKAFIGEIQNKRKNGDIYTAKINISLVFDNNGDIIYYVAIERDITKEKEVDKAKTEFVSLASHQLRTPLSAINWYTEMLLDGDAGAVNEDQKKFLEEIAIGNKRMVDLVDDLLNVSRLDMGTFILEIKPINILDLIKSVLGEEKPQIIEKKLEIEESYDKDLAPFVADEKLLRIVFQNLLSNAVKYTTPSGKLKISLLKINIGETFGEKIIDKESLAFSVSDSGMGIPSSQQDKIFMKLFRADNAKASETEGTGLGLYVIKSIIDLSGGLIWFKSEENKGTTFYVVFPISGMQKKEEVKNIV